MTKPIRIGDDALVFVRLGLCPLVGGVVLHSGLALAQPTDTLVPPLPGPEPSSSVAQPVAPAAPDAPGAPGVPPGAAWPPSSADRPAVAPAANAAQPAANGWAHAPIAPRSPQPSQQIQQSTTTQERRKFERDDHWWTIGVGPLLIGNIHWLDQPKDRNVTVGKSIGSDGRYPGFLGSDFAAGLMVDVRFWHRIGVELDIFRQNDRGTGTVTVVDAGNICFVPGVAIPYPSQVYSVTIGQNAWHIPLLLKLSIPGRRVLVVNHDQDDGRDYEREYRKWFITLALGPEFVIPGKAELQVSPGHGLGYPVRATVSTYLMATGALGFERRLTSSYDIRLLASLRGSYNPTAGSSAMKRGEYAVVDSQIVPLAYKSAWRHQAAMVFGLGWFF